MSHNGFNYERDVESCNIYIFFKGLFLTVVGELVHFSVIAFLPTPLEHCQRPRGAAIAMAINTNNNNNKKNNKRPISIVHFVQPQAPLTALVL